MTPREARRPKGARSDAFRVWTTKRRQWDKLCASHAAAMLRCYEALATEPFPAVPTARHHQLKGRLRDLYEYEVAGGQRVRYKRGGPDGGPVVVYAGSHPPDTR